MVLREVERVKSIEGERGDDVVIKNLAKKFNGEFWAVQGVNVAIEKGNVFGLLGQNGAGKTTLINMLTGRVIPSFGDASVAGKSVTRELNAVRQRSGICPQFDALFPLVPPRQQLAAYCRIKGVNPADITVLVERYLERLDLTKKAENRTDTLSGGQRRKLSVAVALVGDPNIVFLDEPTTGMDPEIRRFVWRFVEEIAPRRVVVLTSHSMERSRRYLPVSESWSTDNCAPLAPSAI